MPDFDDVRRIALSLPYTAEDDLNFEVAGKNFAWPWRERVQPNKPKVRRLDVLVVRVDGEADKQALLAADGDKFFTEKHYDGYAAVLVRLDALTIEELTELITDAWRLQCPRKLRDTRV